MKEHISADGKKALCGRRYPRLWWERYRYEGTCNAWCSTCLKKNAQKEGD